MLDIPDTLYTFTVSLSCSVSDAVALNLIHTSLYIVSNCSICSLGSHAAVVFEFRVRNRTFLWGIFLDVIGVVRWGGGVREVIFGVLTRGVIGERQRSGEAEGLLFGHDGVAGNGSLLGLSQGLVANSVRGDVRVNPFIIVVIEACRCSWRSVGSLQDIGRA